MRRQMSLRENFVANNIFAVKQIGIYRENDI